MIDIIKKMPKLIDRAARREEIARAAATAVAEHGIESVTTADLAAHAGCTVGALPHYYRGKEAILLASLQYTNRSIEARGRRRFVASGGSIFETFSAGLPIDAEARRDARVWVAFSGKALHSKPIADEYRRRYRDIESNALGVFVGRRLPRGWDAARAIENAFAFIDGLAMRALVDARAWPAARQREALRRHLALLGLQ